MREEFLLASSWNLIINNYFRPLTRCGLHVILRFLNQTLLQHRVARIKQIIIYFQSLMLIFIRETAAFPILLHKINKPLALILRPLQRNLPLLPNWARIMRRFQLFIRFC